MPYLIKKNSKGEFCVHKRDGGELVACHDSKAKAEASIQAIYASENKAYEEPEFVDELDSLKQIQRPTQAEVEYTLLSPDITGGKACASCRWFSGDYCGLIENFPDDILATGYCNRWEARKTQAPLTQDDLATVADAILQAGQVVSAAVGESSMAHEDDTHEQPEYGYIAPDSNAEGMFKKLVGKLKGGMQPGLSVIKANGARYMLIVTSNSYQDREQETITSPALKQWVDSCWKSVEDQFTTDNPLVFWHDMRVRMGDIVWADVRGPFLVELAKEADHAVARKLFDYVEAHPDEKWGASHKFGYFKSQKDADGTYHRIFKKETTLLPREMAANLLTYSGVIPMTDKRSEYLNKMLGLPNAAELLDKGIETLVAELKKNGVEHKSVEGKPETEASEVTVYNQLLTDVIKAQAELADESEAAKTELKSLKDELATVKATNAKLEGENAALKARVDSAEVTLKARPRSATRASETEIEAKNLPEDVRKSNTARDPFWGAEVKQEG